MRLERDTCKLINKFSNWVLCFAVPVAYNFTEEDVTDTEDKELIVNAGKVIEDFDTSKYSSVLTAGKEITLLPLLVTARKDNESYVEVVIGVLTAIMLLLLIVFIVILVLSKRHKFQGSPTFFKNPFGVTINMKVGVFLRFTNKKRNFVCFRIC